MIHGKTKSRGQRIAQKERHNIELTHNDLVHFVKRLSVLIAHVSVLTRDIDMGCLSVRLSICLMLVLGGNARNTPL